MNSDESVWYMKFCRWAMVLASLGAMLITVSLALIYGTWIEGNPMMRSLMGISPFAFVPVWICEALAMWFMVGYCISRRESGAGSRLMLAGISMPVVITLFDFTFDLAAASYVGWMA